MLATVAAVLASAYLIGSVNFAILVMRATGRADPRTGGSGNPGATNVARSSGRSLAAVILVLDLTRAALVEVAAARLCPPGAIAWAGLALLLGNRYPVWHGLRGGKGVANYLGFVAAMHPLGAVAACVAWVVAHALTKVPAVASMAMAVVLAFVAAASLPLSPLPLSATALSLLLIAHAHRSNWRAPKKDAVTDPQPFDLEALMPHRPPMRLIDAVRSVDEEAIETEATVRSSWPTVENGCARTIVLVEIVAQSAAALMGWQQRGTPGGRPGLLVGVPHATVCRPLLPVGTRLLCGVRRSRGLGSYCAFEGEVHDESGQRWLEASVQAYRPDDEELKLAGSSREKEP